MIKLSLVSPARCWLAGWTLLLAGGTSLSLASEPAIEEAAVERLRKSMDYLADLDAFALETHSTIEAVLDSGQKIQFDSSVHVTVQRPDKLHARRIGDLVDQEFFYDGKTLVLHDAGLGYYAAAEAPDTLEGMLDFARDSLDIVAPAGDFIYADAFDLLMEGVESGFVVGASYVEGTVCDHLAFSAPDTGTDWQVWIQQGEHPLPRRIVITSRDVLNAPQYTVHIGEWNLAPELSSSDFRFSAPEESTAIEFLRADGGGS